MALYKEASRIIKLVDEKHTSLKSLIYSSNYKNKRQLYALVCETKKCNKVLEDLLDATEIQKHEKLLSDRSLTKALLYDFLFGKGLNGIDHQLQKAVMHHSYVLKEELKRLKIKADVSTIKDLLTTPNVKILPRYVRVNNLKTTVEAVIEHITKEDFKMKPSDGLDNGRYLELLRLLKNKEFTVDIHLPELLVFGPGLEFHEHSLYTSGKIILQDKASCLPAIVLNPPENSHVIDCCAAPGNKTTLLAALMNNKGKIFAFDKDAKRLATMNILSLRSGASCISLHNEDFLKVDPYNRKYDKVEYILVDPSCSGSGIISRRREFGDEDVHDTRFSSRLRSLSSFQAIILKHAMSFPKAKRVVYSTCSIHSEENERVVLEAMEEYSDVYSLKHILPTFGCRGDEKIFPEAVNCVSIKPEDHLTNGFFVACFERSENSGNVLRPNFGVAKKSKKKKMKTKKRNGDSCLSSSIRSDKTRLMMIKSADTEDCSSSKTECKKFKKKRLATEMMDLNEAKQVYLSDKQVFSDVIYSKKLKSEKELITRTRVELKGSVKQMKKHRRCRRINHKPITSKY